ncbi:hypothetical protein GCM10022254_00710 [Actinomadura meridiana]|uniref:Uncharacterized protein n=1 Tax=Actinomadura meridiana TaxID=559626 RepID=A0ABP8BR95_9ACTN
MCLVPDASSGLSCLFRAVDLRRGTPWQTALHIAFWTYSGWGDTSLCTNLSLRLDAWMRSEPYGPVAGLGRGLKKWGGGGIVSQSPDSGMDSAGRF